MSDAGDDADRPRVVVLRALGLGDLLVAVPALRVVRDAFPAHHRTLVAPAALAPLVALLDDAVDTVAPADFRTTVGRVPDELAGSDVAVNLHGRGPQSHRALQALRPSRLVAFANAAAGCDGPDWDPGEHERVRWCRLLGAPERADDFRLPTPPARPPAVAGATVVHPGAAAAARRWPADRWAAVARHERAKGRPVLVTGGPAEVDLAKAVALRAGLDGSAVLAGHTDVAALAAVVAAAGRVACADTGVAHLATAFATPSVVLFGPVPPQRWGPPASGPHIALWAGRTGDPHADRPDPGLLRLTVDTVTGALDTLDGP